MRLLLSLLLPLLLLLAGAEARLKGHDGIFECYTTGSCQLCTHDEMQARGGGLHVALTWALTSACAALPPVMQDVGTACKATGHHQAIECLITGGQRRVWCVWALLKDTSPQGQRWRM